MKRLLSLGPELSNIDAVIINDIIYYSSMLTDTEDIQALLVLTSSLKANSALSVIYGYDNPVEHITLKEKDHGITFKSSNTE